MNYGNPKMNYGYPRLNLFSDPVELKLCMYIMLLFSCHRYKVNKILLTLK